MNNNLIQPQMDLGEIDVIERKKGLADVYGYPPFSVLDARSGDWQDRKRQWLALGIQSELGRGINLLELSPANEEYRYNKDAYLSHIGRGKLARAFGQDLMRGENINFRRTADKNSNITGAPKKPEWATGTGTENMAPGTSIFDPVLCELMYRWFCPRNGTILDPFAGGSVRGIVAHYLGYKYTGIDLIEAQVKANNEQAEKILPDNKPNWVIGDSRELNNFIKNYYDFIFTCPPYYNLEVYSDDPRDLSNCNTYSHFVKDYTGIIRESTNSLMSNRFACFVVGGIRDKNGFYYDLVGDTVRAFAECDFRLYNEAILMTSVGSLPIRVGKQFEAGRKLGKTHQNVLVFYKGNPDNIAKIRF